MFGHLLISVYTCTHRRITAILEHNSGLINTLAFPLRIDHTHIHRVSLEFHLYRSLFAHFKYARILNTFQQSLPFCTLHTRTIHTQHGCDACIHSSYQCINILKHFYRNSGCVRERERERLQKHMPSVCVCILCINRIIFRQSGGDCQNIHCSLKHRWQAIFRYTMANTNTYQATLFAMNLNILLASMVSLVWLGLAMTFTDSFRIDLS